MELLAPIPCMVFRKVKVLAVAFRVVNVVATATLSRPIDIESLPQRFPHEEVYDEEIYGGRVAYFKFEAM